MFPLAINGWAQSGRTVLCCCAVVAQWEADTARAFNPKGQGACKANEGARANYIERGSSSFEPPLDAENVGAAHSHCFDQFSI